MIDKIRRPLYKNFCTIKYYPKRWIFFSLKDNGMVLFTISLDGKGFNYFSSNDKNEIQVEKYLENVPSDIWNLSDISVI